MLVNVAVVNLEDVFMAENVDIPNDGTAKEIDISSITRKPLKAIFSFYAYDQTLSCTVLPGR
jgi:hypothetical protein